MDYISHFLAFAPPNELERGLNRLLTGYPSNHNYKISQKKLFPSFQLYKRLRLITALYSEPLESFMDVGCCRGFFVLEAAKRPNCQVSVGIDVHEPFVSISNRVREYLDIRNSAFHLATLDMISNKPEAYGGPFQTILLIGTYHYLFWGSHLCSDAYYSHQEILYRLSRICTNRLIFSARLEADRLPNYLKEKAKAIGNKVNYNSTSFLKEAGEFFEVHEAGFLGKYPLFLMIKKNTWCDIERSVLSYKNFSKKPRSL